VSSGGHDIYIFPEMSLTGYSLRDDVFTMAEPVDGPSIRRLKEISSEHGASILAGLPMPGEDRGYVHNSAVYVAPDGEVKVYHKHHLVNFGPFDERYFFRPGRGLTTFELGGMTFGIIICFDVFFPELVKAYAMRGVDAIIDMSASPSVTRIYFERVLPARSIENTVYSLYTNLVGTENNLVFWGGCQALDPRGNLIAKGEYFEEGVVSVDLDPYTIASSRPFRPTIGETDPAFREYADGL